VSGTFNNNIVTNAATPAMTWPATTIGNCNVFAGASFAPLVGSDNENASFFLDDYAHPDQFDTVVLDQCANGPTFDIMGTRRPVNGSFDRGAVEYTP
jgi:hypothetical protein